MPSRLTPFTPGAPIGRYVIDGRLARRVWSAKLDGRRVAIKAPASAGRAHHEAAVMTAVQHPNVVPLLDVVDAGRPALVVPRAACSLADLVDARGRLDPGEVVSVGIAIAAALAAMHGEGLVHGDVHPGNVLLADDGTPVLADLELAGPPRRPTAATTGYTAPEVLVGGAVTDRGDQWALATACSAALRDASVPSALAVVLAVAGAADPAERFASVDEFAAALRRACAPLPVTFTTAPDGPAHAGHDRAAARTPRRVVPPTTRRFGPLPPRARPKRRVPGPVAAALRLFG